ncbi:MAG: helix-turn-helix transcriptional regulator [Candidatus Aminicenantes bacterium]|jgi:transcriptional regulator with XRE-family HTH domain|nr:helix-turn-helix transcriptional regulator [Candidatus Aminicenantes bacterium]
MTYSEEVGTRIRNIRKAIKLKQKEFVTKLHIADTSLSDIENGKHNPNFDFLVNLAQEFNVNLDYVFFGKGEMFADRTLSLPGRIEEFAVNINDVRKFLYHFERSPFIQYSVLTHFREMLTRSSQTISKEIEEYEKKQKEKKS